MVSEEVEGPAMVAILTARLMGDSGVCSQFWCGPDLR